MHLSAFSPSTFFLLTCLSHQTCPREPKFFNVDNVRVLKIEGASLSQSQLIKGVAFARDSVGTIKHVTDAKIAVFGCGIEPGSTDTKARVELNSAEELKEYNLTEEAAMAKVFLVFGISIDSLHACFYFVVVLKHTVSRSSRSSLLPRSTLL